MTTSDTKRARQALRDLPQEVDLSVKPELREIYLPPSHLKALSRNIQLVVGMRGAGKTFWCNALQEPSVRELIYQRDPNLSLGENTDVRIGFSGKQPNLEHYPAIDTIQSLLTEEGVEPRKIWQTILVWHITQAQNAIKGDHPLRELDWKDRVAYVDKYSEPMERLLEEHDSWLDSQQQDFLILFDALDRCARDWDTTYKLIRGLMETALEMRYFRRLRMKIFLRPDQKDARQIATFPDASKILSSHVTLDWPPRELYNLLWHLLINGRNGKYFREFLGPKELDLLEWKGNRIYLVSRDSIFRRDGQREKFHEIAGKWMGTNRKRGFPYTWIPNHLADTNGRVSPRSFLMALKKAAEETEEQYPDHEFALHYRGINYGIQEASKRRVMEIAEDYPWMDEALKTLKGIVVPCEFQEISDRWKEKKLLKNLKDMSKENEGNKVLYQPPSIADGPKGVRGDLEELCVFYRLMDDRVNIPDVFRVGYGLGRRGGVKPAR